jgi:hypothetical protein
MFMFGFLRALKRKEKEAESMALEAECKIEWYEQNRGAIENKLNSIRLCDEKLKELGTPATYEALKTKTEVENLKKELEKEPIMFGSSILSNSPIFVKYKVTREQMSKGEFPEGYILDIID